MLIQNYEKLAKSKPKKQALDILNEGLLEATSEKPLKKFLKPSKIVLGKKTITLSKYTSVYLIAYGKAADLMTKTANKIIKNKGGIIVIPKDSNSLIKLKKYQIFQTGHPLPTKTSVFAAKAILKFLKQRRKNELVIFLVSGGGSSLISLPEGISLDEKIKVNDLLIKSGAKIQEINSVRKHLSKIKGGKLVQNLVCDAVALVMSDVMNEDLSSISSGCTYYDKTSFKNSLNIIKKYKLQKMFPKNALKQLIHGATGKLEETPKTIRIKNKIVTTNKDCLKSMQIKAKKLGYQTKVLQVSGNVKNASQKISKLISKKKNYCLIFGGETTVTVTGKGKGGRNQELVLRILKNFYKTKNNVIVASVGTDGIDGNTAFAGAIASPYLINKKEIEKYLKINDSNRFFLKYGGLIKTGYTHTNLMDIGLVILI